MSEEKKLDLSQVSFNNLIDDQAPAPVLENEAPETAEVPETAETPVEEVPEPVEAETPQEPEPEAVEDTATVNEPTTEAEPEDDSPGVIDVLRERMGYEVQGDFSEDYDGVVNFTQQVAGEMAKEQLDSVFAQFPDVEQYLQYRYNGGDPKKYFQASAPTVDYASVEIQEDDVATQRAVVHEHLRRMNYSEEEIAETIQDYVDAGILERNAKRSLTKLQKHQEGEAQRLLEQQAAEAQRNQQHVQQQWMNIQQTIQQGSLRGFNVPEADKAKFYSWMSEARDNQGRTQRMIEQETMDLETQLALEYLIYKKFDLTKLVGSAAATKKAQNLKARLQNSQPASKRMKGGKGNSSKSNKLPSLSELL